MERRQLLRGAALTAAGVASAALAGCGSPPRRGGEKRLVPPTSVAAPSAATWAALAHTLHGQLVLPSDPGYATARRSYDPRFDALAPAAVAYCASATDVQRVVAFAREHGLRPVPRCGGHSYGGYSNGDGALVVDVTPMRALRVDGPAAGTRGTGSGEMAMVVGAGMRLVDLYAQASAQELLVPAGSCPTVGVAGLALGGGIGVLARTYGLTCDRVDALEMVSADGHVLQCDAAEHADLYWACRGGGGGNFGVVTSFTFRAAPVPELALFTVDFPSGAAAQVLGSWMTWQRDAPDALWSNCQISAGGGDLGLAVRSAGVYVGSAGALNSLVDALVRAVGTKPTYRFVGPEAYLHAMLVEAGCGDRSVAQCHLASGDPSGVLDRSASVASSAFLAALPGGAGVDAFVGTVADLRTTLPGVGGGLVFDAYGGAINAVAPGATAFVHRDKLCGVQATVATGASAPAVSSGRQWLAHQADAVSGYVDGSAYQNYIDPTLADWQRAYYGTNLERLVGVKQRYDPDDVFSFAQSIPAALPGTPRRGS
jgi:FAD/FMN-containing dehydrogenase